MTNKAKEDQDLHYFDPGIPGLDGIVPATLQGDEKHEGFSYYPNKGLNIVLHGPAGSGKSHLALQCAMGAIKQKKHVIFLSKDTGPEVFLERLNSVFHCFDMFKSIADAEKKSVLKAATPKKVKDKPVAGPVFWSADAQLVPPPKEFSQIIIAQDPDNGKPVFKWRVVLLDRLAKDFEENKLTEDEIVAELKENPNIPVMAFGSLGLLEAGEFDRYATNESIFEGLSRLCPYLRPIFEKMGEEISRSAKKDASKEAEQANASQPLEPTEDLPASGSEDCWSKWRQDFLVVCDSLPVSILEDCLRAQTEGPSSTAATWHGASNPLSVRAITLFVMESSDMPNSMTASFPPDIQIKLGFRDELHGKRTRTIQVLKARFQEIHDEPFPFIIHGCEKKAGTQQNEEESIGVSHIVSLEYLVTKKAEIEGALLADEEKSLKKQGEHLKYPPFALRKPGITIFRSLPSVVRSVSVPEARGREKNEPSGLEITFGSKTINVLTTEGRLSGGGMTLVATENRCNSTVIALHYLLGEIGARNLPDKSNATDDKGAPAVQYVPSSVLYVALDNDLIGVLHDIWRYPVLRAAVFPTDLTSSNTSVQWKSIEMALRSCDQKDHQPGKHRLYRIPLIHPKFDNECPVTGKEIYRRHLYILIPDLVWCSPEEVLDILAPLFDKTRHEGLEGENAGACKDCLRIDRMVLNRVSLVPANWPLIQDPTLLVSNLIRLCTAHRVDLMVVDDTAKQSETTGHIESRWQNTARNIIRLRRVPFHGTEVVGMELIRASGTNIKAMRPMELRARSTSIPVQTDSLETITEFELVAVDTFRGYTGIFSGKPRRCHTTVDLTYDQEGSPLHQDTLIMKHNLEGIMENVTVNVLGPRERPGVNSALSNLSDVSHDTCHVVSVDEIWLHRLIEGVHDTSGLVSFSQEELQEVLPGHVQSALSDKKDGALHHADTQYVTQALIIAFRKKSLTGGFDMRNPFYAIPFRHNWGVMAVSEFKGEIEETLSKIFGVEKFPDECKTVLDFLGNPRGMDVPAWEDLIEFKGFLKNEHKDETQPKPVRKMYFFDFQRETADSVVSFFLELLLDSYLIEDIFCPTRWPASKNKDGEAVNDTGLLFFKTRDWCLDNGKSTTHDRSQIEGAFKYALSLMYYLLDDKQREELAFSDDLYNPKNPRVRIHKSSGRRRRSDQRTPSFISREWLTTVPKGGQLQNNLQRQIVLKEFPVSLRRTATEVLFDSIFYVPASKENLDGLKVLASEESKKCRMKATESKTVPKSYGVTMSGTWYLGTMSGGNRELATDIIRELVSEYHEMDRFLSGCGAPVFRRFYSEDSWLGSGDDSAEQCNAVRSRVPYANILRLLAGQHPDDNDDNDPDPMKRMSNHFRRSRIVFPFSRARIRSFTMIALVLNNLIRESMQLSDEKVPRPDRGLGPSRLKQPPKPEKQPGQSNQLDKLVRTALNRIDDIHEKSRGGEENE